MTRYEFVPSWYVCADTGLCVFWGRGSIWLKEDIEFEELEAFVTILLKVAQDSSLGGLRPTYLSSIS